MFSLGMATRLLTLLTLSITACAADDKTGSQALGDFGLTFGYLQNDYVTPLDGRVQLIKALRGIQTDPAMSNPPDRLIVQAAIEQLQALPSDVAVHPLLEPFASAIEQLHAGPGSPSKRKLWRLAATAMTNGLDPQTRIILKDAQGQPISEPDRPAVGLEIGTEEKAGIIRVMRAYARYPAAQAGVRSMDILVSVDGQATSGLPLDQITRRLRGKAGSTATLVVERAGRRLTIGVTRKLIPPMGMASGLLGRVAYLQISSFQQGTASELRQHYNNERRRAGGSLSGVILDLRLNLGGRLDEALKATEEFLPQAALIATMKGREAGHDRKVMAQGGDMTSGLPMIVLVDGSTAAGSEILAGALKDNGRAIILGNDTAGAGSVQTVLTNVSLWFVVLTTETVVLPSGHALQPPGIIPDLALRHYAEASSTASAAPNALLARISKQIARTPTSDQPFYDLDHPERDFQVQQALKVLDLLPPQH